MFKILIYSLTLMLLISGAYFFVPDIGSIQINTANFHIETSLTPIIIAAIILVLIVTLFMYIVFAMLAWPLKIRYALEKKSQSKNLDKILQLIYLLDTNSKIRLRFVYDKKIFQGINHPAVHTTNLRVANLLDKKDLKAESLAALGRTEEDKGSEVTDKNE